MQMWDKCRRCYSVMVSEERELFFINTLQWVRDNLFSEVSGFTSTVDELVWSQSDFFRQAGLWILLRLLLTEKAHFSSCRTPLLFWRILTLVDKFFFLCYLTSSLKQKFRSLAGNQAAHLSAVNLSLGYFTDQHQWSMFWAGELWFCVSLRIICYVLL